MSTSPGFLVADARRVSAVLDRLAHRIHAEVPSDLQVVGILRRGVPVAQELGRRLTRIRGTDVLVGTLEVKRYADDLTVLHPDPSLGDVEFPFDVAGAPVLLVDDVVFSGRTLLKAVEYLDAAAAAGIHVATLCSRGGGDVPIHAAFVGLRLDVGEDDVVKVHAPPYEEQWAIRLLHRSDVATD